MEKIKKSIEELVVKLGYYLYDITYEKLVKKFSPTLLPPKRSSRVIQVARLEGSGNKEAIRTMGTLTI